MNKKAAEIGMTHTQFQNPHGLDANGHYSTARDLALMSRYARALSTYRKRCIPGHTLTVGGAWHVPLNR